MARVNHSKINMQKRIAEECRLHDYPRGRRLGTSCRIDFDKQPERWLTLYIGKHKGKTLPQLAWEETGYLVEFLYIRDILFAPLGEGGTLYQKKIAHQLEVIANRMQNIKAPLGKEFVIIVDKDEVFERFVIVDIKGFPRKKLKKGSRIVARKSILDIGLPLHYNGSEAGFLRMSRCLRRAFFGSHRVKINPKSYKAFLEDDSKFELTRIRCNKRLKPMRDDYELLRNKYLASLAG